MTETKNTFIRISNGRLVDLMDMGPEDVDLFSISRALNSISRFSGHWGRVRPLTVAQHTLLCMELAARLYPDEIDVEFGCLLHDMPEAYYNDLSSPMKRCIDIKEFTDPIDTAVHGTLWTLDKPRTEEVEQKVKKCDLLALTIERNVMWEQTEGNDDERYFPQIDVEFSKEDQANLFFIVSMYPEVDLEEVYHTFFIETQTNPVQSTIPELEGARD